IALSRAWTALDFSSAIRIPPNPQAATVAMAYSAVAAPRWSRLRRRMATSAFDMSNLPGKPSRPIQDGQPETCRLTGPSPARLRILWTTSGRGFPGLVETLIWSSDRPDEPRRRSVPHGPPRTYPGSVQSRANDAGARPATPALVWRSVP